MVAVSTNCENFADVGSSVSEYTTAPEHTSRNTFQYGMAIHANAMIAAIRAKTNDERVFCADAPWQED